MIALGTCSYVTSRSRESEASKGVADLLAHTSTMAKASPPPAAPAPAAPAAAPNEAPAKPTLEQVRAHRAELGKLPLAERIRRAKASCADAGECPTDETDDLLGSANTDAERDAISRAIAPMVRANRGDGPSAPSGNAAASAPSDSMFRSACKAQVRLELKNPRSARFEDDGLFSASAKVSRWPSGRLSLYSWVEATDSFGANLRTPYKCNYDPKDDSVSVALEGQ
jgi:hypothetical protein